MSYKVKNRPNIFIIYKKLWQNIALRMLGNGATIAICRNILFKTGHWTVKQSYTSHTIAGYIVTAIMILTILSTYRII